MKNFTAAIICAGGSGSRMKSAKNKLLLPLGGVSVFERTVSAFDRASTVDEMVFSVPSDLRKEFEDLLKATVKNKPYKVVIGGKNREESVKNGITAVDGDCEFISVHDAARPLITPEEIDKINEKAYICGAVCAGTPVKNTVKILKKNGKIEKTLERDRLFSAATPQVFRKEILTEAFEKFADILDDFTDDASLAEALGYEVETFFCDEKNIKITTPEDIKTAEKFLGF